MLAGAIAGGVESAIDISRFNLDMKITDIICIDIIW